MNTLKQQSSQALSADEMQREILRLRRRLSLAETNLKRARQFSIGQDRVDMVFNNSLKKELQFFNLILENTTNILMLFDLDGRLAYTSRTFLNNADIANFSLINGRHFGEVLRPIISWTNLINFTKAVNIAIKQKKTIAIEEEIDFNNKGNLRVFSIFVTPMFDENYKNAGIIALLNDITENKAAMERARRIEIAEESNKAKGQFLARMSHEIRTPMNAILGIAEIQLQDESLPPEKLEAFGKIYNSSNTLLRIINDILDLSKIESGKLELIISRYEIASLLNDTAQLNITRINSKPIEFRLEADENMPSVLLGDEIRIRQILNNLLSNAFKYTAQGEVELAVFAEYADTEEDDDIMLNIRVSDTGQGMTPEQLNELFDEFTRFNPDDNRLVEGAGLGMNITHRLVKMMNGEISVESEPGIGSTFIVRLPQKDAGCGSLGREVSENLQNFRMRHSQLKKVSIKHRQMPKASVLVVDDVETNLYVAKLLMAPYNLSVDISTSGYEAIEKIKNGMMYDIIFMDHMMPRMDGIEAAGIINNMDKKIPVIALTANAVHGSKEMFLKNGFSDFLSKPISIIDLNIILEKWIPAEKQEAPAPDYRVRTTMPTSKQTFRLTA